MPEERVGWLSLWSWALEATNCEATRCFPRVPSTHRTGSCVWPDCMLWSGEKSRTLAGTEPRMSSPWTVGGHYTRRAITDPRQYHSGMPTKETRVMTKISVKLASFQLRCNSGAHKIETRNGFHHNLAFARKINNLFYKYSFKIINCRIIHRSSRVKTLWSLQIQKLNCTLLLQTSNHFTT
jgi:hypothetical protein